MSSPSIGTAKPAYPYPFFDETARISVLGKFSIWYWLVPQIRPCPVDLAEYLKAVMHWLIQVWVKEQGGHI